MATDILARNIGAAFRRAGGGGGGPSVKDTTYEELHDLYINGMLTPGQLYRITDYETIINGTYDLSEVAGQTAYLHYARSAGHQFDLVVGAISESALDEQAIATHHDSDTYFENTDLESWELKYTIENDPNKYTWADETNGKGVIYYMKDENGNEAGYDFKNIQFLAYGISRSSGSDTMTDFDYDLTGNRFGSLYTLTITLMEYLQTGEYAFTGIRGYDFSVGQNILTCIGYPEADDNYLSTFNADFYYTFDMTQEQLGSESVHYDGSNRRNGARNNIIEETRDLMEVNLGNYSTEKLGLPVNIFSLQYEQGLNARYNVVGNNLKSESVVNIFANYASGADAYFDCNDNSLIRSYGNIFVGLQSFNLINDTYTVAFTSCYHNKIVNISGNLVNNCAYSTISSCSTEYGVSIPYEINIANTMVNSAPLPVTVHLTFSTADSGTFSYSIYTIYQTFKRGNRVIFNGELNGIELNFELTDVKSKIINGNEHYSLSASTIINNGTNDTLVIISTQWVDGIGSDFTLSYYPLSGGGLPDSPAESGKYILKDDTTGQDPDISWEPDYEVYNGTNYIVYDGQVD